MCSSNSSSRKRQPDARPISRRTAQRIMEEAAVVEAAGESSARGGVGSGSSEAGRGSGGSREESSSSSRGLSNKQQSPVSETGTGEFIKVNSLPPLSTHKFVCVCAALLHASVFPLSLSLSVLSLSNCQNASKRTSLDL